MERRNFLVILYGKYGVHVLDGRDELDDAVELAKYHASLNKANVQVGVARTSETMNFKGEK